MLSRFFLFMILMTTDILVTNNLHKPEIAINFFWLEVFFKAGLMALITVITVRLLIHFKKLTPRIELSQESILLRTGLIAFTVETVLMLTLPLLKLSDPQLPAIMSCGLFFALLTTILIHFLLLNSGSLAQQNNRSLIDKIFALRGVLLLCYLFSLTLLLLFLLNMSHHQHENHLTQAIIQEQQQLALIKNGLNEHIAKAALETQVLAMQDNLQSLLNNDSDAADRLTRDYLSLATIKPTYEQIRFIDDQGTEVIRVDQSKLGPVATTPEALQNKHHRYYFTDAMKLSAGQVYISIMDLNIENNHIEMPYKPIVRLATPVFDHQGEKRGIVIINLNSTALFTQMKREAKGIAGELMLLNEEGYWLFGRERDAAWAFMFPESQDRTFEKYYPGIWKEIQTKQHGAIPSKYGYFIFDTISTDLSKISEVKRNHPMTELQWPQWKLLSLASPTVLSATYLTMLPSLVMFFILTSAITGIGTLLYFRIQRKHLTAQQEIRHLAHYDLLTGLCNRTLFIEMLELQIAQARRTKAPLALIYMDLDRFKPINDQYGHQAGNYVLQQVAVRLQNALRETDTVARLGGDEFAAILPSHGTRKQLAIIAQRVIDSVKQPILFKDQTLQIGISVGIAIHFRGQSLEALLHEADLAMYQAKRSRSYQFKYADELEN